MPRPVSNFDTWKKKVVADTVELFKQEVLHRIENKYESVIQDFYDDYPGNGEDPKWYERTYSTFLASSGYKNLYSDSNIKLLSSGNRKYTYEVGIHVSSDNIEGEPYRADKEWVFERTFEEGIHGITNKEFEATFRNPKTRNGEEQPEFRTATIKGIKPMSPPPKKRMDDWFHKELCADSTLDAIMNSSMSTAIRRNK